MFYKRNSLPRTHGGLGLLLAASLASGAAIGADHQEAPGATFNADILYTLHFDTSAPADGISDIDFFARFAQDADGSWGLQVSGASSSPLEGPVETVISNSDVTAWGGLADDPFFFDQTGFNQTVATGTLAFDPTRDDVAGLNVTAVAIQIPVATIVSEGGTFQTWSTTSTL